MRVYIAFGDEPTTDGRNILGVFNSEEAAEKCAESCYPSCVQAFKVEFKLRDITKEEFDGLMQ